MRFALYDRRAAVLYAHRWAYGRNPAFYDYEETYGEPLDEERYEIMAAPDDVLARCELYTNLPADTLTLYNDLWTELGI